MDIRGRVLDAEITSKLNVSDCTTSEATSALEVGTSTTRVYVILVFGSTIIHRCRLVLVLQVSCSRSPGQNTDDELVSVTLPA